MPAPPRQTPSRVRRGFFLSAAALSPHPAKPVRIG